MIFLIFLLLCHFLLLSYPSSSLPLCTNSRAPNIPNKPLAFCPHHGRACCDSAEDFQLQKQFESMNISDSGCGSLVKSILCAKCDQFAAELYKVESGSIQVPVLCNTALINSTQPNNSGGNFCSTVWDTCENVPILNSPFVPPSRQVRVKVPADSTSSKLSDFWQTKSFFCDEFGGSFNETSLCFDGKPVSLGNTETTLHPHGLCLEKIGDGSYLNMVAHPDGSNRAFLSEQSGKIWLASVPEQGSGDALGLEDESSPFVDLTGHVYYDGNSFGMMGMAFHPNFAQNGRFFASFICDKVKTPGCSGKCSCNTEVNCDPLQLASSSTAQPCRFHKVVAEFSANETISEPPLAKHAKPLEVGRIFTLGLPFPFSHGGQILFGPRDGYLYVMTGDSGQGGDPLNFSQNKKSLLGKILRLDIDNMPTAEEICDLGLWGNYSLPRDNPYKEDEDLLPEIWALGLRNPWRCSFDSQRPLYFICADTGQDLYEEVDIIIKGGNYGWPIYEGPLPFRPPEANLSAKSTDIIFPVLGYTHSDVDKNSSIGSAAVSGGYFYRSMTDPCMFGSYLYGDLYGSAIWAASESPNHSGNFTTTKVPFRCAHDSPMHCSTTTGNSQPDLGYIYSFGEDNRKDVFILASTGVYRIVDPSRCSYKCSKKNVADFSSLPSSACKNQFLLFLSTFLVFMVF